MGAIRIIVLTVCLAMAAAATAGSTEIDEREDIPRLTVRGESELRFPADQLRLTVGVVSEAPSVAAALETNSARMQEVIAALHKAGLTEQEYQTGRLRIDPQWSPPPRQPPPDWRPRIVGYAALNQVRIRTGRIDRAGELIAAATAAGANNVEELVFDLADPRAYRAEAIREATANALADARVLAGAASVRLARVLTLNLDQAATVPVHMAMERMAPMAAATPPVAPGEVTVRAGVSVTFEIEPLAAAGGKAP